MVIVNQSKHIRSSSTFLQTWPMRALHLTRMQPLWATGLWTWRQENPRVESQEHKSSREQRCTLCFVSCPKICQALKKWTPPPMVPLHLGDCVCYRCLGRINHGHAPGKWAVYVSACAVDIKEAWQTCPLSADGVIHNSICRQFHAVFLPLSSLFTLTERKRFGPWRRKRRRRVVCSGVPQPSQPHTQQAGVHKRLDKVVCVLLL